MERSDILKGFSCGSAGKESACNAGDLGPIPGLGRSLGEGKGYPLQSMDCIVHGVAKRLDTTEQLPLSLYFKTKVLNFGSVEGRETALYLLLKSHLDMCVSVCTYVHCLVKRSITFTGFFKSTTLK